MGSKSSRQRDPEPAVGCVTCGAPLQPRTAECSRCGAKLQVAPILSATRDGEEEEKDDDPPVLKRLLLVPFEENLPEDHKDCPEQLLVDDYLKDFFSDGNVFASIGSRFRIKGVDWKVLQAQPPRGLVGKETTLRSYGGCLSLTNKVRQMRVAATVASIHDNNYRPDQAEATILRPHFSAFPRHLCEGDTFVANGVQFVIKFLQPSNGVVDEETQFTVEQAAVPDLCRVALLPVFESLPNREKDISSDERFAKYLQPYFTGRHRLLRLGEELCIDGIDFKVIAADPQQGLVTLNTEMFSNGVPLRADDMQRQQEEEDEALARRLQMQEGGPIMFLRPGLRRAQARPLGPNGPNGQQDPMLRNFRNRLAEALENMPAAHPNRPHLAQLSQILNGLEANGARNANEQHLVNSILAMMAQGGPVGGMPPPANQGASQAAIDCLPTRKFVSRDRTPEQREEQKHLLSCMICLGDYEKDDELRTLPCFHTYHMQCIDTWLMANNKCPICKNPI